MELTQSNPQMNEEDLDGGGGDDDDDVMEVFSYENVIDMQNLEVDKEVVTMQDINGFILS